MTRYLYFPVEEPVGFEQKSLGGKTFLINTALFNLLNNELEAGLELKYQIDEFINSPISILLNLCISFDTFDRYIQSNPETRSALLAPEDDETQEFIPLCQDIYEPTRVVTADELQVVKRAIEEFLKMLSITNYNVEGLTTNLIEKIFFLIKIFQNNVLDCIEEDLGDDE